MMARAAATGQAQLDSEAPAHHSRHLVPARDTVGGPAAASGAGGLAGVSDRGGESLRRRAEGRSLRLKRRTVDTSCRDAVGAGGPAPAQAQL